MVYEMTISATHHFPRQAAQNLIPSKHIDLYLPVIIMVAGSYRVPPASSAVFFLRISEKIKKLKLKNKD